MKHLRLFLVAIAAVFGLGASAQTWTGNEVAEGSFYLYNVGQGKWLTSGNSWGTQATLTDAGGFYSELQLSTDGKYAICNPETRTNNKGNGPGFLGNNGYMDGEDATYFTFTQAERTDGVIAYLIQDGANNLQYSGNGTVVNFGNGTDDAAQWILVSKQDRLDAMANATQTNPVDATFLLKDPDFGRYKLNYGSWVWTFPGTVNRANSGDNTNFCVESYHVAFDFCQTVADAPLGYYGVRGQAFYRQDGSNNDDLPYFYANDGKVTFPAKTGSENNMSDASNSFSAGLYFTNYATTTYTSGDLKVGAHLDNNTALWCIWDNIQLVYYGPLKDLSAYINALENAVASAEALEGTIPDAAYQELAAVVADKNKEYSTGDEYSAAIEAINQATNNAKALQVPYSRYQTIKNAVLDIYENINTTAADDIANAATTKEEIENAVSTVRQALSEFLLNSSFESVDLDLTAALIDNANPGKAGNTDYWTTTGGVKYANNLCEYWSQAGVSIKQTIAPTLPVGYYKLTVVGYTRDYMTSLMNAGVNTKKLVGVNSDVVNGLADGDSWIAQGNGVNEMTFKLDDATSNLEIGITADSENSDYWTVWRSFKLEYLGTAPLVIFQQQLADAAANAKLDGPVPAAAQEAFNQEVATAAAQNTTVEECLASIAAIDAALAKYNPLVAPYAEFNTIYDQVKAVADVEKYEELTEGAHATLVDNLATLKAQIEAATTVEAINEVNAALKQAGYVYAANANPTDDAQFNLTFLLTNPDVTNFGNGSKADGWYTEQPDGNSQVMRNDAATSEDGTKTVFFEYWSNPAKANDAFALYQKTQLPLGTYNISCYAFAQDQYAGQNSVGVYFFANNTQGSAVTTARLTAANIEFVNDAEQEVKIGLKTIAGNTYNWMGIGYVELYKCAPKTAVITEAGTEAENFPESNKAYATITYEGRTLAKGFNTLALPFNIEASELGNVEKVYAYGGSTITGEGDNAVIHLDFSQEVTSLNANTPYIVKMAAAQSELVFENKTLVVAEPIVNGDYFDFVGTYVALPKDNETIVAGDYISVAAGLKAAAGGNKLNAFRAYLKKKAEVPAGAKVAIQIGDDIVDGIQAAQILNNVDGTIYNLNGQKVTNAQKGIFIQNGKKVVIK